jgi:hypothetical protein
MKVCLPGVTWKVKFFGPKFEIIPHTIQQTQNGTESYQFFFVRKTIFRIALLGGSSISAKKKDKNCTNFDPKNIFGGKFQGTKCEMSFQ